jgi:hypothetical protein
VATMVALRLFACVSVCALLAVRPVEIDGFAICLDFDSLNLGTSAARDSIFDSLGDDITIMFLQSSMRLSRSLSTVSQGQIDLKSKGSMYRFHAPNRHIPTRNTSLSDVLGLNRLELLRY